MSAIRTQYITQTSATITAGPGVETVVDIVRPETDPGVPYSENTDYVTRERQFDQNESGMVVVEMPSALAIAALLLKKVEVMQSYFPAQTGLPSAYFPTGSTPASNGEPTVVRTHFESTAGLAMNSPQLPAIVGAVAGGTFLLANPAFPGISLQSGQFLRLTIENTNVAVGPAVIAAKYDLGVNAVEYRKL